MNTLVRRSALFNRIVLGLAALLFAMIGVRNIVNPLGEAAAHQISLASPEAITIMRVTGGAFLALAIVFVASLTSRRRLLYGTGVLLTVATVLMVVRIIGFAVDGPAPFTVRVLKPEIAITLLSLLAFYLEWRSLRTTPGASGVAGLQEAAS